jgi:hypothetical protein
MMHAMVSVGTMKVLAEASRTRYSFFYLEYCIGIAQSRSKTEQLWGEVALFSNGIR